MNQLIEAQTLNKYVCKNLTDPKIFGVTVSTKLILFLSLGKYKKHVINKFFTSFLNFIAMTL